MKQQMAQALSRSLVEPMSDRTRKRSSGETQAFGKILGTLEMSNRLYDTVVSDVLALQLDRPEACDTYR